MPTSVADLDTPAVVIDLDIVEANIARAQENIAESHRVQDHPRAIVQMRIELDRINFRRQVRGAAQSARAHPDRDVWSRFAEAPGAGLQLAGNCIACDR